MMTQTFSPLLILLSGLLGSPALAAEPAPGTTAAAPAAAPAPGTAPAPNGKAAPSPNGKASPAPAPEASLVDMVKALSQFLTEEEVQMVYDYLWDSSIASLKGSSEEITLPPELAFKLAILQKRIVKEGGHYLEGLALKMEQDLARWQEQVNTPSPPVPYSLPSERARPAEPGTR